jgi:two-component system response regulator (stage 0 sporulation protein F)
MSDHLHRILIVDDDVDICATLSDILSNEGYQTEVAGDGPSALDKLEANSTQADEGFDLCLLDFKMPGMDGVELITRLRDLDPKLSAIMITAYAGEDGVQRAVDAGSYRVLQKPVDVTALLGMIREAVH